MADEQVLMGQPLLYSEIAETAQQELADVGIEEPQEVAERIARAFCSKHKDKTYRVPGLKAITKSERDAQIKADRETMNVKQIARKYGLTTRSVYLLMKTKTADELLEQNRPVSRKLNEAASV